MDTPPPRRAALRQSAAPLHPLEPCAGCGCRGDCDLGPGLLCGLAIETGPLCSACANATGGRPRASVH